MQKSILVFFLISLTQIVFSENNRVHVPIPGISQKFNTEDTIQKLLMVKKIPIQKLEGVNQDIDLENGVLKDFEKYTSKLNDTSKTLYTFDNPFNAKKAFSADETILKATAQRNAGKQEYKIKVEQLATPDSFISDSLKKDRQLSAGRFSITSDKQKVNIIFNGGSPAQLVKILKEQAEDLISIRSIHDTSESIVINIRAQKTGKKYHLKFEGNLSPLLESGLISQQKFSEKLFAPDLSLAVSQNSTPLLKEKTRLILKPGNTALSTVQDPNGKIEKKTLLIYSIHRKIYPQTIKQTLVKPDLGIQALKPIRISNIQVFGDSLISFLEKKNKPKSIESNFTEIVVLEFNDGATKTLSYTTDGTFTNSLLPYTGKSLKTIRFQNKNTFSEFEVADIRLKTQINQGGIQPKNLISKADDALFTLDGVTIKRKDNLINDVVPGVNLELIAPSKQEITLNIDYDYDLIQKDISDWVNAYNQTMEYLSILTKSDQDRTPLHKKKKTDLKKGLFQTESSFINLKNTLRTISGKSYPTGSDVSMLNQIGIYTKKPGGINTGSSTWEAVKMGLLNLDMDKLTEMLKKDFSGVKNIFAYDTDGDLRMDTGVAYSINTMLRFAIGQTGFIERKIAFNKSKQKDNHKEILQLKDGLDQYEMAQRIKFGRMNQAIAESESKQKWLNGQFKSH